LRLDLSLSVLDGAVVESRALLPSRRYETSTCNRPTVDTIRATGFDVERLEHKTMNKVPKFARPLIVGIATTPTV